MRELLQTIPQELYDEIYELTFAAPGGLKFLIDCKYTTPNVMQVDRATRASFAIDYYANNAFALRTRSAQWFAEAFDIGHRQLLRNVGVFVGLKRPRRHPSDIWIGRGHSISKAFRCWSNPPYYFSVWEDDVSDFRLYTTGHELDTDVIC